MFRHYFLISFLCLYNHIVTQMAHLLPFVIHLILVSN